MSALSINPLICSSNLCFVLYRYFEYQREYLLVILYTIAAHTQIFLWSLNDLTLPTLGNTYLSILSMK